MTKKLFVITAVILFLLLLVTPFVLNKQKLKVPATSVDYTPSILGLFTSTSALVPSENTKIVTATTPAVTLTPTPTKFASKSNTKKKSNSKSTPTPTPTVVPTLTDLQILNLKLSLISNYSKTNSLNPTPNEQTINNIFESQLISFFGIEELNKIFSNISSISFTDVSIQESEATAVAIVQYGNILKTYKCYFIKRNNDWFLYKTE